MKKSLATRCTTNIVRAGPTTAKERKVPESVARRKTDNHLTWLKRLGTLAATTIVATGFTLPGFARPPKTTTPIKHVIVIFQENVSFDHYFATFPFAANGTAGELLLHGRNRGSNPRGC
jgi:phospholipase C